MTILRLQATSRAAEAGYLALADIADIAETCGIDYRIVGGQMVSLHVAAAGVDEPVHRQTLDADWALTPAVAGDPRVVTELRARGYDNPDSANRFVRVPPTGRRLVIDLLAPSYTGRLRTNRRHGAMTLDEIPGLSLAMAGPGEIYNLEVAMLTGEVMSTTTVVPDPISALCVKALGWRGRRAAKDAVDVWRLLLVFHQRFPTPPAWRPDGVGGDTAHILRTDFAVPAGAGTRTASPDSTDRARIRALALHALKGGGPPRRTESHL